MKKLVLSLVLFASAIAVSAQPRAIGGRITNGLDVSYQHGFGEKNMLQIDAGFHGGGHSTGIHAAGTYNWVFPISSWKHEGSWNWYPGVGAGLGLGGFSNSYVFLGVAGMIGVEYNFKFPLQLSLDYRPIIGWQFGNNHSHFHGDGFWNSGFGLGVRYKF